MTSKLIAFLSSRLDEDELDAHNAAHALKLPFAETGNRDWRPELHDPDAMSSDRVLANADVPVALVACRDVAPHIARHDPARALREVAAKRSLVEDHTGQCCVNDTCCGEIAGYFDSESGDPCPVLRVLAAIWGDHPDYRQEWAVG